jgi:hypothetical protein
LYDIRASVEYSVLHGSRPAGLLNLSAAQLLTARQAAWLFCEMGPWNGMSFDGEDQTV